MKCSLHIKEFFVGSHLLPSRLAGKGNTSVKQLTSISKEGTLDYLLDPLGKAGPKCTALRLFRRGKFVKVHLAFGILVGVVTAKHRTHTSAHPWRRFDESLKNIDKKQNFKNATIVEKNDNKTGWKSLHTHFQDGAFKTVQRLKTTFKFESFLLYRNKLRNEQKINSTFVVVISFNQSQCKITSNSNNLIKKSVNYWVPLLSWWLMKKKSTDGSWDERPVLMVWMVKMMLSMNRWRDSSKQA